MVSKNIIEATYTISRMSVGRQKPMLHSQSSTSSVYCALVQFQRCAAAELQYTLCSIVCSIQSYTTTSEPRSKFVGTTKSERKFSSVRRASLFQLPLERAIIMMNLQTKFQGVRTVYYTGHTKYCAIAPKQFSTCQIFTT